MSSTLLVFSRVILYISDPDNLRSTLLNKMSINTVDVALDDELVLELTSLDLDPPQYSHDTTVEAITSFYQFVNHMHPDGFATIDYPPSTGWPLISATSFAPRAAAVIELLRYIPYLRGCPRIMADTEPVDYLDHQLYAKRQLTTSLTQASPKSKIQTIQTNQTITTLEMIPNTIQKTSLSL